MKTLFKIFFLMAVISLAAGCNKTDDFFSENEIVLKKAPIVNPAHGLDQERFVTMKNPELTIHYRIIGKGPIDMVFIPGWTNPLTVYTKQFDYFRDKARCIYIDLPGTGMSDAPSPATPLNPDAIGPQYTMELMADAVYAVIKKEGLHKFVGVGFSMGPKVLGMFERNYPGMMYKLVTIAGGFNPWPTDEPARQNHINLIEATYLNQLEWSTAFKQFLAGILVPPGSPQDLLDWVIYFHEFPSDILANTQYYSSAENANEPVDWMYPKLCFYENPSPDMDKVNLFYPNNTVHSFPDGGHCIHWVFHEEINPIIWEFAKDRPGKKY
ncbi:MAG: alpha/beta hydrolase [Bacteroidales bacterium]|nr:alpha/beta hydrolase [Bacteroidales bacterium]MDT8402519.1 alpha/beta hydrolase [Bacteroidales bacterium]